MPAEVVGRLEHEAGAVAADEGREIDLCARARPCLPLRHHSRPGHVRADHRVLGGAESRRVRLVGEHREERLLVRDLAAERVGHARQSIPVRLDQHPRVVRPRHQVGHQRAPVDQVDRLAVRDQAVVDDLEVARVGNQRRDAACREVFGQDLELAPGGHASEVGDDDARRPRGAAPLAVALEQRRQHRVHHRVRLHVELLAKAAHGGGLLEDRGEGLGVAVPGRRLGVVLGKHQRVRQQEGVQSARGAGAGIAGVDRHQRPLGLRQAEPGKQCLVAHRLADDSLADGRHHFARGTLPRLVARVHEQRAQEGATEPAAEEQPGIAHPLRVFGPVRLGQLTTLSEQRHPGLDGCRHRHEGRGASPRRPDRHWRRVRLSGSSGSCPYRAGDPTKPDAVPRPSICSHLGNMLLWCPFNARSMHSRAILSTTISK